MDGHDELAQLAEEFNQLTGRASRSRRRSAGGLSPDASHELKTPPWRPFGCSPIPFYRMPPLTGTPPGSLWRTSGRRRTVSSTSVRNYWSSTA